MRVRKLLDSHLNDENDIFHTYQNPKVNISQK